LRKVTARAAATTVHASQPSISTWEAQGASTIVHRLQPRTTTLAEAEPMSTVESTASSTST